MINATMYTADVFYKPSGPLACAPDLRLLRSWDGSVYGETNCPDLCGPDRLVSSGNHEQPAWIADNGGKVHMMCSSAVGWAGNPWECR